MGRNHIKPVQQPDDLSCGPSALKVALQVLGKRKSLSYLYKLCKTNRNGVTTKNMVQAIRSVGCAVEHVEYATFNHLQSALRYSPNSVRAVMVTYLDGLNKRGEPDPEEGHWAVVSSYSAARGRIVLVDSSTAKKKSFAWNEFRRRWMDYDLKRRKLKARGKKYKLIKKWQQQPLLVIAKEEEHLPWFRTPTSKVLSPAVN